MFFYVVIHLNQIIVANIFVLAFIPLYSTSQ